MRFLSEAEHGIATDNNDLSTTQEHSMQADTNAENNSMNDEAFRSVELQAQIASDIEHQIRHDAISVPAHISPFRSEEADDMFDTILVEVCAHDVIPENLGVSPIEWDDDEYPEVEILRVGRRGNGELQISLPQVLWWPRALLWAQGLEVMMTIQALEEDG